jgi:GNAT superfamily N-acetyltransferase
MSSSASGSSSSGSSTAGSHSDDRKSLSSLSSAASESDAAAAADTPAKLPPSAPQDIPTPSQPLPKRASLVPPHWEASVRYIGTSESRAAGLSLAHSFAEDDLSRYLLGAEAATRSPEALWRMHVRLMTGIAAAHCLKGAVGTIGPDHDAVAIWELPHTETDSTWTFFRSGMWRLFCQLSREGRRRYYGELIPVLHDAKAAVMGARDADCYYLVYIGTKEGSRGRGFAGKLLRDMIAKADAEQRAIYLESSSLANDAYYAKFGFEFKRDIFIGTVAGAGEEPPVRLSAMVREPRPVVAEK